MVPQLALHSLRWLIVALVEGVLTYVFEYQIACCSGTNNFFRHSKCPEATPSTFIFRFTRVTRPKSLVTIVISERDRPSLYIVQYSCLLSLSLSLLLVFYCTDSDQVH